MDAATPRLRGRHASERGAAPDSMVESGNCPLILDRVFGRYRRPPISMRSPTAAKIAILGPESASKRSERLIQMHCLLRPKKLPKLTVPVRAPFHFLFRIRGWRFAYPRQMAGRPTACMSSCLTPNHGGRPPTGGWSVTAAESHAQNLTTSPDRSTAGSQLWEADPARPNP
jgi:hypothetical protein